MEPPPQPGLPESAQPGGVRQAQPQAKAPPAKAQPPPPAPPRAPRKVYLAVRARADLRLALGAAAAAAGFDVAARSGWASVAATAWLVTAALALLLSGRVKGLASRVCIGAAALLGLVLMLRASPWVIVPTVVTIAVLLVLGAALGADGGGPRATFPELGTRAGVALGHLVLAPGMFRSDGEQATRVVRRSRAAALGRGALLAVPLLLIIGRLLALADPIFRSWFDLKAVIQHLGLAAIGAWAIAGLIRAASARTPAPAHRATPSLGTIEAGLVLGGLCALYCAFLAAQFVALSAGGRHVLQTQGLTYAQYARSGFFQLLWCSAITLVVLLAVRACTDRGSRVLTGLSWLTVALTIGVVVIAIGRLRLYEAAFGLTMLRLACLVVAAWIGVVFVLLAATLPKRGLASAHYPAAVAVSVLVLVGTWATVNPASIVARTNLSRAEHGRHLDVREAASLGPDAVPTLVAGLSGLPPAEARALRHAICGMSAGRDAGAAFNASRADARADMVRACPSPSGQS